MKKRRNKTLPPDTIIKKTVMALGNMPMTIHSHGYREDKKETILEAALHNSADYTKYSCKHPAVALMDVILAANRDYKKQVDQHVKDMREKYPFLSFRELNILTRKHTYRTFQKVWSHADEKKFKTLKDLLEVILKFKKQKGETDFDVMHRWASNTDLANKKNDSIGKIKNIGIATYQHLRMTFGADTIKPDLRVKQVLERKFGMKLSSEKAIESAERISKITGYKPLVIDQIFVKYGSGYYRTEIENVKKEVENIIKQLIVLKVSKSKISKATKWSVDEINAIQ